MFEYELYCRRLNLEDTKNKMQTDDKDKDGFVTWDEFTVSTYGMTEEELKDYQENDVEDPEAKTLMSKVGLSAIYQKSISSNHVYIIDIITFVSDFYILTFALLTKWMCIYAISAFFSCYSHNARTSCCSFHLSPIENTCSPVQCQHFSTDMIQIYSNMYTLYKS